MEGKKARGGASKSSAILVTEKVQSGRAKATAPPSESKGAAPPTPASAKTSAIPREKTQSGTAKATASLCEFKGAATSAPPKSLPEKPQNETAKAATLPSKSKDAATPAPAIPLSEEPQSGTTALLNQSKDAAAPTQENTSTILPPEKPENETASVSKLEDASESGQAPVISLPEKPRGETAAASLSESKDAAVLASAILLPDKPQGETTKAGASPSELQEAAATLTLLSKSAPLTEPALESAPASAAPGKQEDASAASEAPVQAGAVPLTPGEPQNAVAAPVQAETVPLPPVEPQDAEAPEPLSPRPANLFNRVNVLMQITGDNAEATNGCIIPFEATVRLDVRGIYIEKSLGGVENVDFWLISLDDILELSVEIAEVIILTTYGKITLAFRIALPSGDNDTERFAHILFPILPEDVIAYGRHGYGVDGSGVPYDPHADIDD